MRRHPQLDRGHFVERRRKLNNYRPSIQVLEPRRLLAATIGDAGFESANVGNGFSYNPAGSAWVFSTPVGYNNGSGVSGNGSAFTSGNPNAPEGTQVGFLQGSGSFAQFVAGWSAGTYQLSFSAAYRPGYGSSQDFQVLIDGNLVGTFATSSPTYQSYSTAAFAISAGTHSILFRGLDSAGGDNTAFIDSIAVANATSLPSVQTIPNAGFEEGLVGNANYVYDPVGAAWTFSGSTGIGSGTSSNGSVFTSGNPAAPEGSQVAFLQATGSISQAVANWAGGSYTLSFQAAQRGDHGTSVEDFEVLIDGNLVATFQPTDTSYRSYSTPSFNVSDGPHAIEFLGLDTAGGDNTVFLDSVEALILAGQSTPPALEDPGFEEVPLSAGTFVSDPVGSAWGFNGSAGIATNNSMITAGNPSAPDGSQVLFVTGQDSYAYQTVKNWPGGDYEVDFFAAQRANVPSNEDFEVIINGIVIDTFKPSSTSYQEYTTHEKYLMAGNYTVEIMGLDTAGGGISPATTTAVGGGDTALIDDVELIQDQQIDAYPISNNTNGSNITAGSDGMLWFYESNEYSSKMGRLDPATGLVTEFPLLGEQNGTQTYMMNPVGNLVQASDGGLWFYTLEGTVVRFDPQSHQETFFPTVMAGSYADYNTGLQGVVLGPDGGLWFVENFCQDASGPLYSTIGRIDPIARSIDFTYKITSSPFLAGLAVGSDGGIWFTETLGDALKIGRIDPVGRGLSEFPLPNMTSFPSSIISGSDGNLWIGGYGSLSTISSFNISTHALSINSLPAGFAITSMTTGPDGAIWAVENGDQAGEFCRIDVGTLGITMYPALSATGISVGPDAALWIAGRSSVERIPVAGRLDDTSIWLPADDPNVTLNFSASMGLDNDGDLINPGDGAVVEWRVEGSGASFDTSQTSLVDGGASNILHTTTKAGDVFHAYARIVSLVAGGISYPFLGLETFEETITVVPGRAANITFKSSPDYLISDGHSQTTITLTARDAEGNLVADGTSVNCDLAGGGQLINPIATTTKGQATVTLQAGVLPEDQLVAATIDGYQDSTSITSKSVNISLGITGNVLILGTGMQATVTATVTDADGNPVPNGTPITWFTQKGTFANQSSVVMGGVAYATLSALGGSQVFGYGYVRAFVGSNPGSTRYLWLPQQNGFTVKLGNPQLSGDAAIGGTISVPQSDGSSVDYSYDAQTLATISGPPGAVIQISAGMPGLPATGILNLVGDGGQSGTATTVTLDSSGNGSYLIQSLGNVQGGGLVLPISMVMDGDPSTTMVNYVDLAPAQFIAQTKDLINQMGWAVLTGESDTMTGMAADVGFSLIPVVGAWTDVRDMSKELLRLWPGGESPNWYQFGFAVAGFGASFLGPEVDWLPTVLKKLASKVGGTQLFTAIWQIVKSADVPKLLDLRQFLVKVVSPGSEEFLNLVNTTLVKNFDDLDKLNYIAKGLANNVDDLESMMLKVANNADYVDGAPRHVMNQLVNLFPGQISDLQQAGKLDYVTDCLAKANVPEAQLQDYATWMFTGKGWFKPNEQPAVDYLLQHNFTIEPNLLHETVRWGETDARKSFDIFLNNVPFELKKIEGAGDYKNIKNTVNRSLSNDSQAANFVIDARGLGTTYEDALRAFKGIKGGPQGQKLNQLLVILNDGRLLTFP